MSWKENQNNAYYVKNLQCDPISTYEPLYINAIRERQNVYFEVSSKNTLLSTCFVIHLRPPLSLRNALPIGLVVSVAGCSVIRERGRDTSVESDIVSLQQQSVSGIRGEDFLDYGEKLILPGELLHLPTVKTSTKNADNPTYIVARVSKNKEFPIQKIFINIGKYINV